MDTLAESRAPATEPSRPSLPAGLVYLAPRRTWAGRGSGMICDLCRSEISVNQVEYEVELPQDGSQHSLRLHLKCYQLWFSEMRRRRR